MTTVLATHNLDFSRKRRKHRADLKRIKANAHIAGLQELRGRGVRKSLKWLGRIVHPKRPGGDWGSEALWVRKPKYGGPTVIRRFRPLASPSTFGERIGLRRMPAALIDLDGPGRTLVISVHWVPPRMQGGKLEAAYRQTLLGLIDLAVERGFPWIVLGDLNDASGNPLGLVTRYPGTHALGKRIDYVVLSKELVPFLRGWHQEYTPKRDHPVVYARLGSTPQEKS